MYRCLGGLFTLIWDFFVILFVVDCLVVIIVSFVVCYGWWFGYFGSWFLAAVMTLLPVWISLIVLCLGLLGRCCLVFL